LCRATDPLNAKAVLDKSDKLRTLCSEMHLFLVEHEGSERLAERSITAMSSIASSKTEVLLPLRTALGAVRRVRGSSQACVLIADDGHQYITKFQQNPFGCPMLVRELLAAFVIGALGIHQPPFALIYLSDTLPSNSGLIIHTRENVLRINRGPHFGSRCVADPNTTAIYDFLPDVILTNRLTNALDFAGMLIVDNWLEMAEKRQAVYTKVPGDSRFTAFMIDNGAILGAPQPRFMERVHARVYSRPCVYDHITNLEQIACWVAKASSITEAQLAAFTEAIPQEWLDSGGRDELKHLVTVLINRQATIFETVAAVIREYPGHFRHLRP